MSADEAPPARTPRTASSVHDVSAEKPPFGSRFLTEDADVWSQNAWDHVPPPDDQDEVISAALIKQKSAPVPDSEKAKYNEKPARHWYVILPPLNFIHAPNMTICDSEWQGQFLQDECEQLLPE